MNAAEYSNFFKMDCPKCNQSIDCPFEYYDQMLPCPTCGESILARPRKGGVKSDMPVVMPSKPRKSKSTALLGVTAVLVAVFFALALWRFGHLATEMVGGVLGMMLAALIGLLVLIWAVLWIVFPVFVYYGMNRIEKLLQQIERNTRKGNREN